MHRTTRWLALGAAVFLLAACSHKDKNAPLAYVPANTPYVIANLKPLTDEARAGLTPASASSTQQHARLAQVRHAADEMEADHKPHLANLLRAFANSAKGKTYEQMATDAGIDPHGLFAIYGLGLSPVGRGQLSDPAKFHAYVAKLEKAYGKPFAKSTLDDVDYQHIAFGKSGLQLLISSHDKHYVVALLPAKTSKQQLRLVLGLDHPEHSLQSTGKLAKLAKTDGYGPYMLGYLDTTKLPALIAGANDPLLKTLIGTLPDKDQAKIASRLPASCKSDLARIAARVPLISAGYTTLQAKEQVKQIDVTLAPDIVKAFQGIGTHVPGLGHISDAPLDIAVALPMPAVRDFWLSQAEAVEAKPFTCPALTSLNKLFAGMQKILPKSAIPPFGGLRGLRLVIDHIDLDSLAHMDKHQLPTLSARLLVASKNPGGLLNLAKAMIPGMAQLDIKNNAKPVALPAKLVDKIGGQAAWVALNDRALAIGMGQGEKEKLDDMLNAKAGDAGTLARSHLAGKMYAAWLDTIGKHMAEAEAKSAADHKQPPEARQAAANAQASLAAAREKLSHLDDVTTHSRLADHGIRITADTRWK